MKQPRSMAPIRPRALGQRTPAEQAAIADAVRSREVWQAWGPVAGVCGHRHVARVCAERCVNATRPYVGLLEAPPGTPGRSDPPPTAPAPDDSWVGRALFVAVLVMALLAAFS